LGLLLSGRAIKTQGMTGPDDLVRREAKSPDKETARIKNPSPLEEWAPTGKTIAIIAIITAIIVILSDFFSK
jgi:hypothetical protein